MNWEGMALTHHRCDQMIGASFGAKLALASEYPCWITRSSSQCWSPLLTMDLLTPQAYRHRDLFINMYLRTWTHTTSPHILFFWQVLYARTFSFYAYISFFSDLLVVKMYLRTWTHIAPPITIFYWQVLDAITSNHCAYICTLNKGNKHVKKYWGNLIVLWSVSYLGV